MNQITNNKKKYSISNNETINKNNKNAKIKSVDGYDCIGPCYPADTFYYNPINLTLIKNNYPSCPIKPPTIINPDGSKSSLKLVSSRCDNENINKGYLYFDIFSDYVQISTSSDNFLSEIYNLNTITDTVHFLSTSLETLPIYSQRRVLKAIYEVYYKYVEFPKILFAKKLLFVLKNIYKINNLDENKILLKLNNVNDYKENTTNDLYKFFY